MKYFFYTVCSLMMYVGMFSPAHAAEVGFKMLPVSVPYDGATVVQVSVDGEGAALNAVEGTIGLLGEGASSVLRVVIETGDSTFTLWPVEPMFDEESKSIRFTGGSTEPFSDVVNLFRIRMYTESKSPITLSWLSGEAYAGDGVGTPIPISSRSLTITPEVGVPNPIRSTSDDRTPPTIISTLISHDEETFNGAYFLSVYATDDSSGISHIEVIEDGVHTRIENGTYQIMNQNLDTPLLVVVYDKAGNSNSVKVPLRSTPLTPYVYHSSMALLVLVLASLFVWRRKRNK